jgi:D-alanyl-lipoteichoic acid acyltransferase DltB (MBOAT superfamily)
VSETGTGTAAARGKVGFGADARPLERGRIRPFQFLAILGQLGLLTLVLRQFQIESGAFLRLALLAFVGFAIHALLPLRYRLPFFLALSLAGIALVLGLGHGAWLVGIGLVLIGICHLPVRFAARIALLLVVAGVLALQRAQWLPAPWSEAIWPILGSMFMFRLIVYLYDLRHATEPASPVPTLAYFFMLPNACFPLFPVVDYKAFRRTYFDDDAYRIYQVGVEWMLRGVVHLILYRVVYYYFTLAPSEVHGPVDLAQYLVSNFLLYLRVSGTFHLVVGMLYLFGFRLPETHHRYLLASSFTDFWRRINIYWKDFMLKVFYYPAYFRLRRFGTTPALILSTLFVFLMTWFLHAYQWFWLRGTVLFVWQDILFWTILGVLVVINSLWEAKHGRERTLGKTAWTWRRASTVALKTAGTFAVICVLWSFWTTESIAEWLSLWTVVAEKSSAELGAAPLLLAAAMLVGGAARTTAGDGKGAGPRGSRRPGWRAAIWTTAALVALLSLGIERVYTHFGETVASIIQPLRSGRLSRLDNAALERGYYENLLQVNRFNSQLWEVYAKRPANWLDIESGALKRHTGGFAQGDLIPSFVASTNYGTVTINRWGMRDRDYELQPPPGVFRIALLGPSNVMGWGVGDGETFEALLEDRLNLDRAAAQPAKYEILNFGVPGYQPPQQLVALEKAFAFHPDAVFYVATGRELSRASRYMVEVVQKRIANPYPFLSEIVAKAGLTAEIDEASALRRLAPFRDEILAAVYRHIVEECRARGRVAVWIFLPQVREGAWQEETPDMLRIAAEAGFVIVDLADVYRGEDPAAVRLAEWDEHPNARGHRLIAERLYAALQDQRASIFPITESPSRNPEPPR